MRPSRDLIILIALLLLVPALGLGLYLLVGRPDLPAEPLSDRTAELADYHALTAELEAACHAAQANHSAGSVAASCGATRTPSTSPS